MSSVKTTSPDVDNRPPEKLRVLDRVLAIPLVNLIISLVAIAQRKSPFLESVLNRVKRGFFAQRFSTSGSLESKGNEPIFSTASESAATLVKNCSASVMSSRELVLRGRRRAKCWVEVRTRYVLHSLPGRVALWVVDRVCGAMAMALYLVRPDLRAGGHSPTPTQNGSNKQALNTLSENLETRSGMLFRVYVVITKPFELMVGVVQFLQWYLHAVAEIYPENGGIPEDLSPEKRTEIQARRKVSPKKKLKTGFLTQLQKTVGFFGLSRLVPGLRHKFNISIGGQTELAKSPNKVMDEKKRKHDDILSESETSEEGEEEGLQMLDLDNYISEEDPDFKPIVGGDDSTDSEEYRDGDTESDIEFDTSVGGSTQVRTKPTSIDVGGKRDKDNKPDASKAVDSLRTKDQTEALKANHSSQDQAKKPPQPAQASHPPPQQAQASHPPQAIHPPQANHPNQAKAQITSAIPKSGHVSVQTPPRPGAKSSALKTSTPKNTGKENTTPPKPKATATNGPKKTPDSKSGTLENGNKKTDSKTDQLANGDKKPASKSAANGGKKVANGDKK